MRGRALLVAVAAAAAVAAASAAATPPVGPLPTSPTTTIATVAQEWLALALPRGQSGLRWRLARAYDTRVVRQRSETDVGDLTIVVLLTLRPGTTTVVYALTNGAEPKAYRAARYRLVVKPRPPGS